MRVIHAFGVSAGVPVPHGMNDDFSGAQVFSDGGAGIKNLF